MSQSFSLVDLLAVADLQTYLSRAARVEEGSVRLIAGSGVLAVYTAILYPRGLMDETPTVLGLRTFATGADVEFDVVVPIRSLLDRVARVRESAEAAEAEGTGAEGTAAPIEIRLPLEVSTVTWAGISPPRGGWQKVGETSSALLQSTAKTGVAEVAEAVPTGTGEQLVQRVRAEVWGRPIDDLEYIPAGAAFAADSLGFVGDDDTVTIHETGRWTRLTTRRGHTLVRRQAWTLRR
ncbi:hypothetical protein [Leifsonia sp. 1010]|uniref:hypothetical protein n=1 Tax=Leifsonia sp. 1010 TaxID=2817769 RepID=UPI00285C69BE|nr:hypothetical protein [Leifsonia sp. 1010]MDR6613066.1 hypothetical protein [Leifsonia sp. 1010]